MRTPPSPPPPTGRPSLPYDDLDRPDGGMTFVWLAVQIVAVVVVLIPLLVVASMPFSDEKATVTADQAAGRPVWVSETRAGRILRIDCPSVVDQLTEPTDAICEQKAFESTRVWLVCLGVVLACVLAFAFANRRWRDLRRSRSPWIPTEEVTGYRQSGARPLFWTATVAFGSFTLLIDAFTVEAMLGGSFDGNARGAVWFTTLFVGLTVLYGWRHGYALEIDGDELVWKAQLRSRRLPIADLVGFTRGTKKRTEKERTARVLCRDGTFVSITLPDSRHEWQFRRLVDALRLRVPFAELGAHTDDQPPKPDLFAGDL